MRTRCFGRRRPARRRTSEQKPPEEEEEEEEERACVLGRGERQRRRRHRRGARQWASRDARWQPQRSNLPHRTEQQPQQARRAALPLRHLRPTAVCPAAPEEPTRARPSRKRAGSRGPGWAVAAGANSLSSLNSHAKRTVFAHASANSLLHPAPRFMSFSSSSSASSDQDVSPSCGDCATPPARTTPHSRAWLGPWLWLGVAWLGLARVQRGPPTTPPKPPPDVPVAP